MRVTISEFFSDARWREEIAMRELRDTLDAYQSRGYDVTVTSNVRRVVMCRVAERLCKLGVLCLIIRADRIKVL